MQGSFETEAPSIAYFVFRRKKYDGQNVESVSGQVFGVWFLDYKLRIDDPVGAVAVHCLNGIWGTIAVGLFATNTAPGYSIANAAGEELVGLFYGGGFELLGLQLLGFVSVAAWTAVTIRYPAFALC